MEIPITYFGRGYDEGKKITWKDFFPAVWALIKYRFIHFHPTFLVLQDRKQLIRLQRKMPDYLVDIQVLKSYRIFDNYVNNDDTYFYKINVSNP